MILILPSIEKCVFAWWFGATLSHLTYTHIKFNLDISYATVMR
jgi:hypothetical protein